MKTSLLSVLVLVSVATGAAPPAVAAPAPGVPPGSWPLRPRPVVVRGFEPPPKPWLPGHRGVDLAGSTGELVRSAAPGVVVFAGPLAGRGVVVVAHGALRTTYEPVVAEVRAGTTVAAGAPLGRLSSAGSHCAPRACLHWGLLRGSEYLDPLLMIGSSPVRLLREHVPGRSAAAVGRARSHGRPGVADRSGRPAAAASGADVAPAAPVAGSTARGASPAAIAVVGIAALTALAGAVLARRH